jgi:antitoxin (DNA-binding transcriptional repressor) of toxin-antitoxin stability system
MSPISVQEIQSDPVEFVRRLEAGEELLVVRDQRPLAEIHPITGASSELRPYGLSSGKFVVPTDFDEPLPNEVLETFEGR